MVPWLFALARNQPFTAESRNKGCLVMTAQRYFTGTTCPYCPHAPVGLQLFRSPESVANPIIFCATCFAGGDFKKVTEGGKALILGFVTQSQVDDMLREMGVT
jgi:hypothetical protein